MGNHLKILFRLSQDEDGYPPVSVEGVWAIKVSPGRYTLDSIPFFVGSATIGDTVAVDEDDGNLWFYRVVEPSRNSLLRVVLFDPTRVQELRQALSLLGCSTEWDKPHTLVSINVPESVALGVIQAYLQQQAALGWLDYEEPILRQ